VVPINECPVICHGLVSASHLNGELGEVKEITHDGSGIRMWVYFEKKGVKSELVKPENCTLHLSYQATNSRYVHMNKLKKMFLIRYPHKLCFFLQ